MERWIRGVEVRVVAFDEGRRGCSSSFLASRARTRIPRIINPDAFVRSRGTRRGKSRRREMDGTVVSFSSPAGSRAVGRLCQARSKCLAKGVTSRFSGPKKSRKYLRVHVHQPRSPIFERFFVRSRSPRGQPGISLYLIGDETRAVTWPHLGARFMYILAHASVYIERFSIA